MVMTMKARDLTDDSEAPGTQDLTLATHEELLPLFGKGQDPFERKEEQWPSTSTTRRRLPR
jgi:hypothetical protein